MATMTGTGQTNICHHTFSAIKGWSHNAINPLLKHCSYDKSRCASQPMICLRQLCNMDCCHGIMHHLSGITATTSASTSRVDRISLTILSVAVPVSISTGHVVSSERISGNAKYWGRKVSPLWRDILLGANSSSFHMMCLTRNNRW